MEFVGEPAEVVMEPLHIPYQRCGHRLGQTSYSHVDSPISEYPKHHEIYRHKWYIGAVLYHTAFICLSSPGKAAR